MSVDPGTAREAAGPGRWPDFFIVGQAKSGTPALHLMLDQHERIFMPEIKEPGFFSNEMFSAAHRGRGISQERYLRLFAGARGDQLAGDASTQYICSEEAADKIAAVRPDARIIVFFRDPAAFIVSLHLQLVQNRYEPEADLARALALEDDRAHGRHVPKMAPRPAGLLYTRRARYLEQLRRYERVFPAEQILPVIYEDFRADNRATLTRIFEFLGVPDDPGIAPVRANPTVQVRSARAQRVLYALSAIQETRASRAVTAVARAVPPDTRRRAVAFARDRLRESTPRDADPVVIAELRARLRREVAALGEHLNRDLLGLWGY